MQIRHIRQFILAAEGDNPAAVSTPLFDSTARLTDIHDLEAYLGVRLFSGDCSSMRLTGAGKVFLQDAKRLLVTLEQARLNAHSADSEAGEVIQVALPYDQAPDCFAGLLAQHRDHEPDVRVRFHQVVRSQQLDGIHQRFYDLGFSRLPADREGVVSIPFWDDTLVVVMPYLHPLAGKARVGYTCLSDFPLLLQSSLRDWQVRSALGASFDGKRSVEYVSSPNLLLSLVAAGFGLGVMHHADVEANHRGNLIVRPVHSMSSRGEATTWLLHSDHAPAPYIQRFIYRLATYFAATGGCQS